MGGNRVFEVTKHRGNLLLVTSITIDGMDVLEIIVDKLKNGLLNCTLVVL